MATQKTSSRKTPDRKTEALSIRIDPRSRYGLELLARLQRRSTTGVVEWVLQEAFKTEVFQHADEDREQLNLDEVLDRLWHINDVERLVALAIRKPQLLTFEESRLWKVLKDTSAFWLHQRYLDFEAFDWKHVLPQWDKVVLLLNDAVEQNVVRGLTEDELRKAGVALPSIRPTRQAVPPMDDFDDSDIPF